MALYDWKENEVIKKKMILRAKHTPKNPLLISITGEYEDAAKFQKQVRYWWMKYRHKIKRRKTLVDCIHIDIENGDIKYLNNSRVFVFPREQLSPLTYDEIDELLNSSESADENLSEIPLDNVE